MRPFKRHTPSTLTLCLTLILSLAGCVAFPELDARVGEVDRTSPFPDIIPLTQILTIAEAQAVAPPVDISARIAALNARANLLRGAVVDSATRARMRQGVLAP